jgi:hypothetical protein
MNFIKKHRVTLLFTGVVFFTIISISAAFYSGYSSRYYEIFSLFLSEPIRYILLIIYVIVVFIAKELSRNRKAFAIIAITLMLFIGLIPSEHFLTLGALLSIHNANPEQFRDEARTLFDEYGPNTMFHDGPPRDLYQYASFPRSKIPLPILKANIGDVFILDKYILIEKFGLGGSFRGFIVFKEDTDIWKDEKPITLLEGCSDCWKIRIIDGLYWYDAAPIEEENARLDFLSE